MHRKAFTLIEITAVILILLILIGISLPMLNKGTSHHEAKFAAHCIQSLISLCRTMASSSGKVYFLDSDYSSNIKDNFYNPAQYPFSVLRIYSATWNTDLGKVQENLCGEAYDVPLSIAASYSFNTDNDTKSDKIYFKPDGGMASDVSNIFVCPEIRKELYYKIELNTSSATLTSFKDE